MKPNRKTSQYAGSLRRQTLKTFVCKLIAATLLTNEQLAVELQVDVSVSRRLLRRHRQVVQSKRRLLDVSLGSDSMPSVVIQRDRRLDLNFQWAVTNIEGENHPSRRLIKKKMDRNIRQNLLFGYTEHLTA